MSAPAKSDAGHVAPATPAPAAAAVLGDDALPVVEPGYGRAWTERYGTARL
jgi:hypothetical protein